MLTSREIVLLRIISAFWVKHALSMERKHEPDSVELDAAKTEVNLPQDDVLAMFDKLASDYVRYVVVDEDTNHAMTT